MTDYHTILSRAVATLESDTTPARRSLYDRARGLLTRQLRTKTPPLSEQDVSAEEAAFEAAIERVEAEYAHRNFNTARARKSRREMPLQVRDFERPQVALRTRRKYPVSILFSGIAALAIFVLGAAGYAYMTTRFVSVPRAGDPLGGGEPKSRIGSHSTESIMDAEELAPGVDGGSTDSGIPYSYRRQPVYYRTVYSVGMVLIDRPQRFLYLVQPRISALRYGIGIGGECRFGRGLYHITRKEEWPEWVPSPELSKRRNYPARLPGMPGNPMGARALYFDDNGIGIHGTNTPKTIGYAISLGCLRMVNDDVVDLYNRVTTETAVLVMN